MKLPLRFPLREKPVTTISGQGSEEIVLTEPCSS